MTETRKQIIYWYKKDNQEASITVHCDEGDCWIEKLDGQFPSHWKGCDPQDTLHRLGRKGWKLLRVTDPILVQRHSVHKDIWIHKRTLE